MLDGLMPAWTFSYPRPFTTLWLCFICSFWYAVSLRLGPQHTTHLPQLTHHEMPLESFQGHPCSVFWGNSMLTGIPIPRNCAANTPLLTHAGLLATLTLSLSFAHASPNASPPSWPLLRSLGTLAHATLSPS